MLTKLLCEFGATALMIIFGVGVHCDTVLKGTKYQGSGHMFAITTWSFGISVCLFVFGGAVCMNPAMVLAQCIVGLVPWNSCIPFMLADMLGGFAGACIDRPKDETLPDQWTSQIFARILAHHPVIMVTDLCDHQMIKDMHMTPVNTLEEALKLAFEMKGADAKVAVIPDGLGVVVAQH